MGTYNSVAWNTAQICVWECEEGFVWRLHLQVSYKGKTTNLLAGEHCPSVSPLKKVYSIAPFCPSLYYFIMYLAYTEAMCNWFRRAYWQSEGARPTLAYSWLHMPLCIPLPQHTSTGPSWVRVMILVSLLLWEGMVTQPASSPPSPTPNFWSLVVGTRATRPSMTPGYLMSMRALGRRYCHSLQVCVYVCMYSI